MWVPTVGEMGGCGCLRGGRSKGIMWVSTLNWGGGKDKPHVHVKTGKKSAKFWVDPVGLASSKGFNKRDLEKAKKVVRENEHWLSKEYKRRHGSRKRK